MNKDILYYVMLGICAFVGGMIGKAVEFPYSIPVAFVVGLCLVSVFHYTEKFFRGENK